MTYAHTVYIKFKFEIDRTLSEYKLVLNANGVHIEVAMVLFIALQYIGELAVKVIHHTRTFNSTALYRYPLYMWAAIDSYSLYRST